jgi:ATP adenylyltransferase
MKQLWAPWRLEYIQGEEPQSCIFCDPYVHEDKDGLVLYRGPLSTVLLNKYPYNSGHLLVAPKMHKAKLEDLTPEEASDLLSLVTHSIKALKKELEPEGFNIGMNLGTSAGAGVIDHLHWHIVPRWQGDVNFMPLLAEVKVIPEHLLQIAKKLRPHFKDL